MSNEPTFVGDEKWKTVLINPGTVEVLDENKKTLLKAKTKERVLKKQEREIDPKIIPKEKNKLYDPKTKPHKTSTNDEEKEEDPETIVIIKKQEISREIGEATNANLSPTTEKKIQYEKYVDNPDKYLKQKKAVLTTLVDEKTDKPEFKLTHGKDYVEKQKTTTYATEITPARNPKLAKLDDRDEYMFSNPEAEKEFKKNERKLVKDRRDKYANREKTKIREVVSTDIQERRLRATMVIQKWFKNRKATNTLGERPNLPPPSTNGNNTLIVPNQKEVKQQQKIKGEEMESKEMVSSETNDKKKERRKRDKRKKMSTSLSQDNIQVNDKVSEEKETLFKNKLLLQSFQQSDNKPNMNNNSGEKNGSEDQYKKIKDDLNKLFEQKKAVEEKLQKEQKDLEKLTTTQKEKDENDTNDKKNKQKDKNDIEKNERKEKTEKKEKSDNNDKIPEKLEKKSKKDKVEPSEKKEKNELKEKSEIMSEKNGKFEKPELKPEKAEKPNKSDKLDSKENIQSSSTTKETKKKAGFAQVDDEKDSERNLAIEKRRKTGGLPLKKKKKKASSQNRYDIDGIREMEKEAASIIQVFYRYHLKKKLVENSKIKCHKSCQVELDLLLPSGMFQNLNSYLKDPKNPSSNMCQALSFLMYSFSKSLK